jgi:hypothetical protein
MKELREGAYSAFMGSWGGTMVCVAKDYPASHKASEPFNLKIIIVCPGTSLWEADVPEGGDFLTLFS